MQQQNATTSATPNDEAIRQLKLLVRDIEATGGLIEFPNGARAPAADPEWLDLGDRISQIERFLWDSGHRDPLTIHHENTREDNET